MSALNQALVEVEVIVVNDGSTDKTSEILKSFGSQIQVIQGEGRGSGPARNLGVRSARGDLIAFLDADDIWATDKLVKQLPSAEAGYIVGAYARYFVNDPLKHVGTSIRTDSDQEAQDFILEGKGMPLLLSSMVFSKSDFERIGGFDPAYVRTQDYELLVRACLAGLNIRIIRENLVYYRLHLNSETVESYFDQFLTAEYVRAKYFSGETGKMGKWIELHGRKSDIRRRVKSGSLLRRGIILFYSGQKVSGICSILASALLDPRRTLEKFKRQANTGVRSSKK